MSSSCSVTPRALRACLLLAAVWLTLPSCGGSQGTPAVPAHQRVPLTQLLHPSTPTVGYVDMEGLRRSPDYTALRAALGSVPESETAVLGHVLDVLDRTDELVLGYDSGGSQQELVNLMALRGRYQDADLDTLGALPDTRTYREYTLREGYGWAVVTNQEVLLLGARQAVHDALDRLDGVFPGSGPTRPGYAEAATQAQLGQRDVSAVFVFTEAQRALLADEAGDVPQVLRENALSAGFSAHARDGLEAAGFLTTNDARAVQLLAHELREALGDARADTDLAALGLSSILPQVQVTEDGETLRVALRVGTDETRALVDGFAGLLRSLGLQGVPEAARSSAPGG